MTKPLPPFSKQFHPIPTSGIRVVVGPDAWDFADRHRYPIMVLPEGELPSSFVWPSDGKPALIFERGECDDERLDDMARELLKAGASSVVALREALINDYDPCVFYDKEVISAAA
jgi:hypothetical protein